MSKSGGMIGIAIRVADYAERAAWRSGRNSEVAGGVAVGLHALEDLL
jgi:hypothetical protein